MNAGSKKNGKKKPGKIRKMRLVANVTMMVQCLIEMIESKGIARASRKQCVEVVERESEGNTMDTG